MATTTSDRGTVVTHPDSVDVTIYPGRTGPGMRTVISLPTPEGNMIAAELGAADVGLVDAVALKAPKVGGFRAAPGAPLEIEVPIDPGQGAILLVESGGVYSWRRMDSAGQSPRGFRTARFTLAGSSTAPEARGTRNVVVDWLMDKVRDKITAYVFKFAVRTGAKAFVSLYEAKVLSEGPIAITGLDPARWTTKDSPFVLPDPAPSKVLLLIHGTFSTTKGSFGALTSHAAGRVFLDAAYREYGTVLGYDHSTLAEDPAQNAGKIFDTIGKFPDGTVFDVVAFSRGALVARTLFEGVIAASGRSLTLRRSIYVGSTNAGTHLAEPTNVEDAVDLYTNIIVAGARALSLLPGAAPAGLLLSTGVRTLGTLVHYLADTAINERVVPGLAAMQPDGDFVKKLNEAANADKPAQERYAIVSSFKADLNSPGFTKALVEFVADRVLDRIFKKKRNDLVVDSESMTNLGTHKLKAIDDYGETNAIYHTIYFAQERVAQKLTEWLGLGQSPAGYQMPAMEISASEPFEKALAQLNKQKFAAPVLIRRSEPFGTYLYVKRVSDFADAFNPVTAQSTVAEVFNLHEFGSSLLRTPGSSYTVGSLVLANDARVEGWEGTSPIDERGAVIVGDTGVLGVRLQPPKSILISTNDVFNFNPASGMRGNPGATAEAGGAGPPSAPPPPSSKTPASALPPPGPPDTGSSAPVMVGCEFSAEMPPYPKLNEPTELLVRISREQIEIATGDTAKKVKVDVNVNEKIAVVVIPRNNCKLAPERSGEGAKGTREIDVPSPGKPVEARFNLVGTAEGPAEVLVEAWQSGVLLLSILLEPVFVVDKPKLQFTAKIGLFASPRTDDCVVLRIYEVKNGGEMRLKFIVDSRNPPLNIDADSENLGDVRQFIEDQYKVLERAMPAKDAGYRRVEDSLRAAGNELWTRVVPKEVRGKLWENRGKISAIQVISEEPFVPWEIAVMSDVDQPMEDDAPFLSERGLLRWVTRVPWPSPTLKIGTGPVRYVAPDYQDESYKLPGKDDEVAALKALFNGNAMAVPARTDDVLKVLRSPSDMQVLHFICHGETTTNASWNAELLLEGDVVEGESFIPDTLGASRVRAQAKLSDTGSGPIVFLNACRVGRRGRGLSGMGGFAEAFLRPSSQRGASVFIGPMWNVNDKTAAVFAGEFYRTLLQPGTTLVEAVKKARKAAKEKGDPTWLAYSVYGDPFSKHEGNAADA
jgi:hypothetical protein